MSGAGALLLVRALVPDPADRAAFDRWYAVEHLPQALAAFGALRAFRAWSELEPGVHYAVYELATVEAGRAILASPALRALIAEFDRHWAGRVERTRDLVRLVQAAEAAA